MKAIILSAGISYVVGMLSTVIMVWWAKHRLGIAAAPGEALHKLEERMGRTLPKWVHDATDKIANAGVAAADKFFSDGAEIRRMLRILASGNPAKLDDLKTKLLSIDIAGNIAEQLPEEYKALFKQAKGEINQEKHEMATKMIDANLKKELPVEMLPSPEVLKNIVQVTAAANKVNEESKVVTQDLLEKMIKESQARQEALKK